MDLFDNAITHTLQWEAGFQKDPEDAGNWTGGRVGVGELRGTKYGISAAAHPGLDIENLTIQQAKDIYVGKYWEPLNFKLIKNEALRVKLCDMAILSWDDEIGWLQEAANLLGAKLKVDKRLGPATAEWINRYPHPEALLCALKGLAFQHYVSLSKPRFLAGWLNRLES